MHWDMSKDVCDVIERERELEAFLAAIVDGKLNYSYYSVR
jgi:hypothetical protein